jgi:hypothetical protein
MWGKGVDMTEKESRGFGWLLEQAKTTAQITYKYIHNENNEGKEKWVSVGLVEQLQEQLEGYRISTVKCTEWILKYTLLDPNDTMLLTQVQAVLRTFIEKEVLGISKSTSKKHLGSGKGEDKK